MTSSTPVGQFVDALADYIALGGSIKFRELKDFLEEIGVNTVGDQELNGEHVNQPHVCEETLLDSVSDQYVHIVEALFKTRPVMLMIGDLANFRSGEEPWWVTWTGHSQGAQPETDAHSAASRSDHLKYAYHKGAHLIRTSLDRICEMTYKGAAPSADECDVLCDMHIELHQLLYGATLFILRNWSLGVYPPYDDDDDRYSDGRLVVSPIPLPTEMTPNDSIPATAYCGGIGEEIPTGHDVYIWQPGDDHAPQADRDTALTTGADYSTVWKANADLRALGFVEWSRNDAGRIIKRARPSGRLQPVSRLTPAGLAEYDRFADPTADCDDVQTNPDRQE